MGIGYLKVRWHGGYVGWLTGVLSSFWIVTGENERKFWPSLLRRTLYLAKLSEYEFVPMPWNSF